MGSRRKRYAPPEKEKYRVNRRIRIREVFLIDQDENQIGPTPTSKALQMAQAAGLDLVEVAPHSRPPVAKILDYGRFKYEQKKKSKSKAKSPSSVLKEVRVRPKIDVHDLDIKIRKAREFLDAGHKVQVTCLFRGREMAYQSIGREVMLKVAKELEDIAKVERDPRMEGRRMNLLMGKRTTPLVRASEASGKPAVTKVEPASGGAMPLKVIREDDFGDLPSIPAKAEDGAESADVPDTEAVEPDTPEKPEEGTS
ncbi:MAG: translation initiation factor IF-3 [Planctomycetota bacterium]